MVYASHAPSGSVNLQLHPLPFLMSSTKGREGGGDNSTIQPADRINDDFFMNNPLSLCQGSVLGENQNVRTQNRKSNAPPGFHQMNVHEAKPQHFNEMYTTPITQEGNSKTLGQHVPQSTLPGFLTNDSQHGGGSLDRKSLDGESISFPDEGPKKYQVTTKLDDVADTLGGLALSPLSQTAKASLGKQYYSQTSDFSSLQAQRQMYGDSCPTASHLVSPMRQTKTVRSRAFSSPGPLDGAWGSSGSQIEGAFFGLGNRVPESPSASSLPGAPFGERTSNSRLFEERARKYHLSGCGSSFSEIALPEEESEGATYSPRGLFNELNESSRNMQGHESGKLGTPFVQSYRGLGLPDSPSYEMQKNDIQLPRTLRANSFRGSSNSTSGPGQRSLARSVSCGRSSGFGVKPHLEKSASFRQASSRDYGISEESRVLPLEFDERNQQFMGDSPYEVAVPERYSVDNANQIPSQFPQNPYPLSGSIGSANNTISERDHSSQILSETHYRSGFPHNHYGALPQSTSPNYQEARFRQQTSESALPPFPIHGSNVNQLQGQQHRVFIPGMGTLIMSTTIGPDGQSIGHLSFPPQATITGGRSNRADSFCSTSSSAQQNQQHHDSSGMIINQGDISVGSGLHDVRRTGVYDSSVQFHPQAFCQSASTSSSAYCDDGGSYLSNSDLSAHRLDERAADGSMAASIMHHQQLMSVIPRVNPLGLNDEESGKSLYGAHMSGTGAVSLSTKLIYNVKFKRTQRSFVLSPHAPRDIKVGSYVKVEADRGEDLGIVISRVPGDRYNVVNESSRSGNETSTAGGVMGCGATDLKKILRPATDEEISLLEDKLQEEESLLNVCRVKVKQRGLAMNVVDAEYQFDRHKVIFFFEAEGRVDFRELVRDLFSIYKTRIWMQQLDKGSNSATCASVDSNN